MLIELNKCRSNFQRQIRACGNGIVQHFVYLHLTSLILINKCYIDVLLYCCKQAGILPLLFIFLLLLFLLFYVFLLFYGLMP